jgi:hypothetical protein
MQIFFFIYLSTFPLLNACTYIHVVYRYALYSRNANLVGILKRLVHAYNHRVHSALYGMTPAEVINNEEKEFMLRLHRYPWLAQPGGRPVRAQIDPHAPQLGTFVRVAMKRSGAHTFAKETDTHATAFSHALYQVIRYDLMFYMRWAMDLKKNIHQCEWHNISAHRNWHPPSMRLVLLELGAKRVERRHFYLHEIQPSIYNPDTHFVVDKVLARRRGPGNRPQVLVRFLDYHDEFLSLLHV